MNEQHKEYTLIIEDLKQKVTTLSNELIKSSQISQQILEENEQLKKAIDELKHEYLSTLKQNSEEVKFTIMKYKDAIQKLEQEINFLNEENKGLNTRLIQMEYLNEVEMAKKKIDSSLDKGAKLEIEKWMRKYQELYSHCVQGGHTSKLERMSREVTELRNLLAESKQINNNNRNSGGVSLPTENGMTGSFISEYRLTESREYEENKQTFS
jgi:predicted RNase H-like nuclease (RuvC/YqgF family)